MDRRIREPQGLGRALLAASEDDRIGPQFLQMIDLRTGQVVSFEVTLSWKAENGEAVCSVRFLAIADETGLINSDRSIAGESLRRSFCMAFQRAAVG